MSDLLTHEDPAVRLVARRAQSLDASAKAMRDPEATALYGDAANRMALGLRAASRQMLTLAKDIAEGREAL